MDSIRVRDIGAVSPLDGLGDVVALFKAAREWSIEVDEQLRAEGHAPTGATLGMPAGQLDAIIVILERAQARAAMVDRALRVSRICTVACGALAVINLLSILVRWWF